MELSCSIGDEEVDGKPYVEIVEIAREYIRALVNAAFSKVDTSCNAAF